MAVKFDDVSDANGNLCGIEDFHHIVGGPDKAFELATDMARVIQALATELSERDGEYFLKDWIARAKKE